MLVVRRVVAAAVVLAAVLVWVLMKPETPSTADQLSRITIEDGINQSSADSAPQQAVVNGWTTRDLLTLIADQNEKATAQSEAESQRTSTLILVGVVGLALFAATSMPRRRFGEPEGSTASIPVEREPTFAVTPANGVADSGRPGDGGYAAETGPSTARHATDGPDV